MGKFSKHIKEAAERTLQYHDELNPKIWDGDRLQNEVRTKLTIIAHTWAAFANIPPEAIVDIILVGGNANYNYTPYSDIDLHLVVDIKKLPDCPELLDDYLKDKKQLWGMIHDIKIRDHDVELYAQDKNTEYTKGQGVYSIKRGVWIVRPEKQQVDLDDPILTAKVDQYTQKIDTLISSNADDSAFDEMKSKFREMRAAALKQGGEFSLENLVFKELRNQGHLDRMTQYILSRQDKQLSL
jgi:hypothetical protein